jgi:hypothetical protein
MCDASGRDAHPDSFPRRRPTRRGRPDTLRHMICAACEREISGGGIICLDCNATTAEARGAAPGALSHRELTTTVRRMKALVVMSLVFGIVVAPFTLYVATKALFGHGGATSADPVMLGQLILLRRLAAILLVLWAFVLGARIAWITATPSVAQSEG